MLLVFKQSFVMIVVALFGGAIIYLISHFISKNKVSSKLYKFSFPIGVSCLFILFALAEIFGIAIYFSYLFWSVFTFAIFFSIRHIHIIFKQNLIFIIISILLSIITAKITFPEFDANYGLGDHPEYLQMARQLVDGHGYTTNYLIADHSGEYSVNRHITNRIPGPAFTLASIISVFGDAPFWLSSLISNLTLSSILNLLLLPFKPGLIFLFFYFLKPPYFEFSVIGSWELVTGSMLAYLFILNYHGSVFINEKKVCKALSFLILPVALYLSNGISIIVLFTLSLLSILAAILPSLKSKKVSYLPNNYFLLSASQILIIIILFLPWGIYSYSKNDAKSTAYSNFTGYNKENYIYNNQYEQEMHKRYLKEYPELNMHKFYSDTRIINEVSIYTVMTKKKFENSSEHNCDKLVAFSKKILLHSLSRSIKHPIVLFLLILLGFYGFLTKSVSNTLFLFLWYISYLIVLTFINNIEGMDRLFIWIFPILIVGLSEFSVQYFTWIKKLKFLIIIFLVLGFYLGWTNAYSEVKKAQAISKQRLSPIIHYIEENTSINDIIYIDPPQWFAYFTRRTTIGAFAKSWLYFSEAKNNYNCKYAIINSLRFPEPNEYDAAKSVARRKKLNIIYDDSISGFIVIKL